MAGVRDSTILSPNLLFLTLRTGVWTKGTVHPTPTPAPSVFSQPELGSGGFSQGPWSDSEDWVSVSLGPRWPPLWGLHWVGLAEKSSCSPARNLICGSRLDSTNSCLPVVPEASSCPFRQAAGQPQSRLGEGKGWCCQNCSLELAPGRFQHRSGIPAVPAFPLLLFLTLLALRRVCVRVCACVCMGVCVRACVRVCVCKPSCHGNSWGKPVLPKWSCQLGIRAHRHPSRSGRRGDLCQPGQGLCSALGPLPGPLRSFRQP